MRPIAPSDGLIVGLPPWLPWPLSRWRWCTTPVAVERLAALRIGIGFVLLCDILGTYLPNLSDLFGSGTLGEPTLRQPYTGAANWRWSLFDGSLAKFFVESPHWSLAGDQTFLFAACVAWAAVALMLTVGFWSRLSAVAAWLLTVSFANLNPNIDNAGDTVRGIALFYLMLTPCGAACSFDAWRRKENAAVYHFPWALRLLFVQMILIYFCNGLYKVGGDDWRNGVSLYYVLCDMTLTRWSYAQLPIPVWVTVVLTYSVLVWELTIPLLVLWRRTRTVALWFGVAFHLGIFASMELGGFAPYMLCLYLPLVPWERWGKYHPPRSPEARG